MREREGRMFEKQQLLMHQHLRHCQRSQASEDDSIAGGKSRDVNLLEEDRTLRPRLVEYSVRSVLARLCRWAGEQQC